ncbi:MAG: FAD-dependent oxidoreductase, partial [Paracoccaceae bacterium]|nr:FAD-dependent oxidoreductase [Paracoccaceae bacterium]
MSDTPTNFDVIIIGAGPGGYVCAIRCAQLGLRTAVVEGRETLGDTCLNVGCIPSKALLHASHSYHEATHNFARMGLVGDAPKIDFPAMIAYKQSVVDQNTKGIEFLFKKNKVTRIQGWARISAPGKVQVGDTTYDAKNIVIATGSEPSTIPGVEVDEKLVVSSTGALELEKVPASMVVIGAGVIGLELGSVYARLGTQVTVVEFLDHITPGMDGEISKTLQRSLKKQGLKFVLGAAVQKVTRGKKGATVSYKLRKDESLASLDADIVLVATGRRPFTKGLGLEEVGVAMTERGQVKTDGWKTSVPGIWAIGDVITGPMLAHKAEDEGIAVAESIAGQ